MRGERRMKEGERMMVWGGWKKGKEIIGSREKKVRFWVGNGRRS